MSCLRTGALAAACVAALGLAPTAAAAATGANAVEVTSSTLVAGRQEAREGTVQTVVPAYEFLTLRARRLANPWVDDLSVFVQGYGTADLAGSRDRLGPGGDMSLAYIEGALLDKRLSFRAGRQFVTGGAARISQLDGVSVVALIGAGVGLQGWGGAPVAPRFGTRRGDAMGGGRLFWRHSFETEVGASFQEVLDHGRTARQEVGLDGRALVMRKVVVTGAAFVVPVESRLAEARLEASWEVTRGLAVAARWQRTAPDLFLARDSILSVFVSDEQRDATGASVTYLPLRRWSLFGEFLRLTGNGTHGYLGGARAAFSPGPYIAGAELRAMTYGDDGYVMPRVFATWRAVSRLTLSADLAATELEKPMNGQALTVTATASTAWEFAPGWRVVGGVVAGTGPFYERRFEGVARLDWNQAIHLHEGTP